MDCHDSINLKNIYETEYNDVLFDYDFIDLIDYEKQDFFDEKPEFIQFIVENKKTGKKYMSYVFNDTFNELHSAWYNYSNDIFDNFNINIPINHPSFLRFIGYSPYDFTNRSIPVFIFEYAINDDLASFLYDDNFKRKSIDGSNSKTDSNHQKIDEENNIFHEIDDKNEEKNIDNGKINENISNNAIIAVEIDNDNSNDNNSQNEIGFDNSKKHLLNDTKRLIIIYGIASGLSYMHSNNITHGNIITRNIKLDDYLYPKITDFLYYGLPIENEYEDVGDFANIVYTLIYNKDINDNINTNELNDTVPSCYNNLIKKCCKDNKKERPTLEEIVYHLKTNQEFITNSINKKEFQDYINYVEISQTDQNYLKMDLFDFVAANNFSFRKVHINFNTLKKEEKIKFEIDMGSIDISDYEKMRNIGEGNFGVVYNVIEKKTNNVYAAKKSKYQIDECPNDLIVNLQREINIISLLNHNSILQFIGYSPFNFKKSKRKPIIITEYVSNGSLGDVIANKRMGLAPHEWDDTKKLINIYGIASGMK